MAVLTGFIQASLAQGDAVFVAIPEGNAQLLRQELDGGGTVQVWRSREEIICQVADAGRITDPLVGHRTPPDKLAGGYGLWLVNQVGDLVQARTGQAAGGSWT